MFDRRRHHSWTWPQIRHVASLWAEGYSCDLIADLIAEPFGVAVSRNAIISLARRYRDLMPERTPEQLSMLMSDAAVRRHAAERALP